MTHLAVTDDEVMVRLGIHHIPPDEQGGRIHTTYSEWKPLGQPFSMDLQSFGTIMKVALRYQTPDSDGP